eukprot:1157996-Pelagomonas_calceolata.AAC.3
MGTFREPPPYAIHMDPQQATELTRYSVWPALKSFQFIAACLGMSLYRSSTAGSAVSFAIIHLPLLSGYSQEWCHTACASHAGVHALWRRSACFQRGAQIHGCKDGAPRSTLHQLPRSQQRGRQHASMCKAIALQSQRLAASYSAWDHARTKTLEAVRGAHILKPYVNMRDC